MADDDDYGRRRNADYEYALTGGKALPKAEQEPTALEKKLLETGMPKSELADTVRAINWTIEQTGLKAHPAEQEKGVKLCMGKYGDEGQVREITNMVVEGMIKKGASLSGPGNKAGGMSVSTPKGNQFKP